MGLGSSIATAVSERTAVVIEDYMFDASVAGELTPEVSPSDFHDTWDLDGTDFTPEASPDDEGYWDDFSNLITNGGFDADSDWTKGTGWTISGGTANSDGTSGSNNLSQSGILVVGEQYEINITISNYVSGNVEVSAGASPRGTITANGTYTFYQTCTPSTTFYIIANSFDGSIDNVSVTEYAITPLDV